MTMNLYELALQNYDFGRGRTLATLDAIDKLPNPQAILGWRPGAGRAHIAWQLMHVGITEELFATERLLGTPAQFTELIPRFKGGSTPDENIPTSAQIREVLAAGRQHLRETYAKLTEADLERIPEALKERGWKIRQVLPLLAWHEAHHQGQAHLTLNLWKAAHPS